jgi:hypothetical protein
VVAALAGQAGAQAPTPNPIVGLQTLVSGAVGQKVLDIRGVPNAASSEVPPVITTGGPDDLAETVHRAYHLDFVCAHQTGGVIDNRLTATVNAATVDRRAAGCPFAGFRHTACRRCARLITAKTGTVTTFAAQSLARSDAITPGERGARRVRRWSRPPAGTA